MTRRIRNLLLSPILLGIIVLLGFGINRAVLSLYRTAYPIHYVDIVLEQSESSKLDPAFIFAVILCESGFDERAVSYASAKGLMQITKLTFEWAQFRAGVAEPLDFDDLFIPEINVKYGAIILRLHLDEFGSEREALAAYHTGRSRVKEWLANPEYSSDGKSLDVIPSAVTGWYVDQVLKARDFYNLLYSF